MMKPMIGAMFLALAFALPANAAGMAACDEATMMKVDDAMKADTDPKMKEAVGMAMKEMDMARMAMKDNKMDDCSMHVSKAMDHMMMKP